MNEPKLKRYYVYYWSCNRPHHRHKTKDKAEQCNQKKFARRWTAEEEGKLIELRESGLTYKEVGRHFNVSASYARTKYFQVKRNAAAAKETNSLGMFSTLVQNTLRSANINELEELTNQTAHKLLLIPNFGALSLSQVRRVLKDYGLTLSGDQ